MLRKLKTLLGKSTKPARSKPKKINLGLEALEGRALMALTPFEGPSLTVAAEETHYVTGYLFQDFNGNAAEDEGEPGLPNAKVFVDVNGNGAADTNEPTTYSGAFGAFRISGVPAGEFDVLVDRPGWETTLSGKFNSDNLDDFRQIGVQEVDSVGDVEGIVFQDRDGDGMRGTDEAGLADRQVFADDNENGVWDPNEAVTRTDDNGHYRLTLASGEHLVHAEGKSSQPVLVQIDVGEIVTEADIATTATAHIFGQIYHDLNASGHRDLGEEGDHAEVYLDLNQNGRYDENESLVTADDTGRFEFADLTEGQYLVRVRGDESLRLAEGAEGKKIDVGPREESLNAGEYGVYHDGSIIGLVAQKYNTPFAGPHVSGQTVYADLNHNGQRDSNEPSSETAGTGGSLGYGAYRLQGLKPGTYDVRVETSEGWHVVDESTGNAVVVVSGQETTINPILVDPGLEIDDVQVIEGDSGYSVAEFAIKLQAPSEVPITVAYKTVSDNNPQWNHATAGKDFQMGAGSVTFAPGEQTKMVRVRVLGDRTPESLIETFQVQLQNARGAVLVKPTGLGMIVDNDRFANGPGLRLNEPADMTPTSPALAPNAMLQAKATKQVDLKAGISAFNPNAGKNSRGEFVQIKGNITVESGVQLRPTYRVDFYWSAEPTRAAGRSEWIGVVTGKASSKTVGVSLPTQDRLTKPQFAKYVIAVVSATGEFSDGNSGNDQNHSQKLL